MSLCEADIGSLFPFDGQLIYVGAFHGTPEEVAASRRPSRRLRALLIMGQAGFLDHEETVKGKTRFVREVYPRLNDLPETG
jgi:hypothetical protein